MFFSENISSRQLHKFLLPLNFLPTPTKKIGKKEVQEIGRWQAVIKELGRDIQKDEDE